MSVEKIGEIDWLDCCPNCYKKGRKRGIVIGAIVVLFAMTFAHVVANGILYWR